MKTIVINSKKYGTHNVFVDDEDYEFLSKWKWCLYKYNGKIYSIANDYFEGKRKMIKMHRVIMRLNDPNIIVDHKDRNGLNNQKSNLRIATLSENAKNRKSWGSSRFLGVSLERQKVIRGSLKCYLATIEDKGKRTYIGIYETEEEAAKAYDKKAKELHGEFANLNFK